MSLSEQRRRQGRRLRVRVRRHPGHPAGLAVFGQCVRERLPGRARSFFFRRQHPHVPRRVRAGLRRRARGGCCLRGANVPVVSDFFESARGSGSERGRTNAVRGVHAKLHGSGALHPVNPCVVLPARGRHRDGASRGQPRPGAPDVDQLRACGVVHGLGAVRAAARPSWRRRHVCHGASWRGQRLRGVATRRAQAVDARRGRRMPASRRRLVRQEHRVGGVH